MSASATEVAPATVHELLQAYTVHRTGGDASDNTQQHSPEDTTQTSTSPNQEQRTDWLPDRRRVPGYRAVASDHTWAERPGGLNQLEDVIVTVVFLGVYCIGLTNKVWRSTGEKINDRWFRYQVGGQW